MKYTRRDVEVYVIGGVLLDLGWLPHLRAAGVDVPGFSDPKLGTVWAAICRIVDRDDAEPTLDAILFEVLPKEPSETEERQWRELLMMLDESPPATANPARWAAMFRREAGKAMARKLPTRAA